jgi:hypothetical protein
MNIAEIIFILIGLPIIILLAWLGDSKRDVLNWSDDDDEEF